MIDTIQEEKEIKVGDSTANNLSMAMEGWEMKLIDSAAQPVQKTTSYHCELPLTTCLKAMMQSENSIENAFHICKLEISDKKKDFIELLRQLTYLVIEDVRSGKIVAIGSVFLEKKFVRNCGKARHIEDVVVDSSACGMQSGKIIFEYLADHAHSMGCIKRWNWRRPSSHNSNGVIVLCAGVIFSAATYDGDVKSLWFAPITQWPAYMLYLSASRNRCFYVVDNFDNK
ncbi:hypothetical protein HAX54_008872 [Datura stramonium]|uniref:Glucosamine 6-phosphate N-acetyltransferase n=1 Tax=Datura stramonium TaxID=4076 RepID=A0ABS8TE60_DATST|nr:hypothetical protein [Datura stramonium]